MPASLRLADRAALHPTRPPAHGVHPMQKFGVNPTVIDRIQDHLDSSSGRSTYQLHGYDIEMRGES